jgi:hypothetical protein
MYRVLLVATAAVAFATASAYAGVFVEGSSFTASLVNSPGNVNATATIESSLQVIVTPQGAVGLTITETPIPGGGEWIGFNYEVNFGTIAGDLTANWGISEVGLLTNQATTLARIFVSFDHNDLGTITNLTPTSCAAIGGGIPSEPAPGGSGPGCLSPGLSETAPAGPLPAHGISLNPFDNGISSFGINPSDVSSVFEAFEFLPQSGGLVPEPAGALILVPGVLGLLWAHKSGRKTSQY